jgi:hypothetical protein
MGDRAAAALSRGQDVVIALIAMQSFRIVTVEGYQRHDQRYGWKNRR